MIAIFFINTSRMPAACTKPPSYMKSSTRNNRTAKANRKRTPNRSRKNRTSKNRRRH